MAYLVAAELVAASLGLAGYALNYERERLAHDEKLRRLWAGQADADR